MERTGALQARTGILDLGTRGSAEESCASAWGTVASSVSASIRATVCPRLDTVTHIRIERDVPAERAEGKRRLKKRFDGSRKACDPRGGRGGDFAQDRTRDSE
ncbi:hypothetical protein [Breoghania sp.]|uniref:hypothetical protein n=1 Tax=Breoghania sp. TaxID=2065378 RepID=UPI0026114A0C|nr:hypothetical protein [Breoghania sp.]MDJ0931764.1 hypothetical protein [Breoghania sp.]